MSIHPHARQAMSVDEMLAYKGREFVHFKGGHYRLEDFAYDSETRELMVVYRALYETMADAIGGCWVRPAKMFFEHVERDGYSGPRFTCLG